MSKLNYQLEKTLPDHFFQELRSEEIEVELILTPEQKHVLKMLTPAGYSLLDQYEYCDHVVFIIQEVKTAGLFRYRVYSKGRTIKEVIPVQ